MLLSAIVSAEALVVLAAVGLLAGVHLSRATAAAGGLPSVAGTLRGVAGRRDPWAAGLALAVLLALGFAFGAPFIATAL